MARTLASNAHFNNYDPSSFGWPHRVPDLVPLQVKDPVSGRLINFGSCARAVHPVFVALLTELLPHIPGGADFGPKDDWAYSATDDLPDGSWSFHRYGIAFDLNWRENPMGDYSNNPIHGKGVIPYATAVRIARKYGCEYGGSWSGGANRLGFKDYMHFEFHGSPADARAFEPAKPPKPVTIESPFPYRFKPGHVVGAKSSPSARVHGGITAAERRINVPVIHSLRLLGFYDGPHGTREITAEVVKAIRAFQRTRMHAKRTTGTVGLRTWLALRREVRNLNKKGAKK